MRVESRLPDASPNKSTALICAGLAVAVELKNTLMRFSGRQTKRARPHTAPALLAGLWTVLTMLEYLENHDLDELKNLVQNVSLPFPIFKSD